MKKFILKTLFFTTPFLLSFLLFSSFGTIEKGDLIRMGCLIDNTSNYRDLFNNTYPQNVYYKKLSDINKGEKFDVLIIGDSFSGQGAAGYPNFLANDKSISVAYNNLEGYNSLEIIHGIINGGILDSIKVKYVLIQSVERYITLRGNNLKKNKIIKLSKSNNHQTIAENERLTPKLFSRSTLLFPIYNLFYLFDDNAYFSEVYRTKLINHPFSTINDNELLFFKDELKYLPFNNDEKNITILNNELNTLSTLLEKKGIQLIVLPSPDKYDAYYEYIEDKKNYPRPMFFDYLAKQQKKYIYINSKEIITDAIKSHKDVYFYDDTHWSPVASRLIAKEIAKKIKINNLGCK